MNREELHVEEYITLEDVISSENIMMVSSYGGKAFFINLDPWETPEKEKEWYRFSIDPFDLNFLKFQRIEEGFISDSVRNYSNIYTVLKYLKVCRDKYTAKNASVLNKIFFSRDDIKTALTKYNDYQYYCNDNHNYISYKSFCNLKNKFKEKIIDWLKKVFKEYNEFDDSIEYIKDYYYNWVILVDTIQYIDTVAKYNTLWKFMDKHKINSVNKFRELYSTHIEDDLKCLNTDDKNYIENVFNELDTRKKLIASTRKFLSQAKFKKKR